MSKKLHGKRKKRKKRKKTEKNRTFNKTKNVSAIIYFGFATLAMILIILWYLNIYRV